MNLDKKIVFKINGLIGKNRILDVFSLIGGKYILYFIIGLCLFFYYFWFRVNYSQRPGYENLVAAVVVFGFVWFIAWIISLLIGFIVRRPRPYVKYPDKIHILYKPIFEKWKSMPSDHAMTCAVATSLMLLIGKPLIIILFIILSLWVFWGRIYAGVHYLSDIIIGVLVGVSVSFGWIYFVMYYLAKLVNQNVL